MAHLSDKIKISLVPLLLAVVAAALLIAASVGGSSTPTGTDTFRADLQSHQDGDGPPKCRPASKYAGDPRPNDPECKHKPEKH